MRCCALFATQSSVTQRNVTCTAQALAIDFEPHGRAVAVCSYVAGAVRSGGWGELGMSLSGKIGDVMVDWGRDGKGCGVE